MLRSSYVFFFYIYLDTIVPGIIDSQLQVYRNNIKWKYTETDQTWHWLCPAGLNI